MRIYRTHNIPTNTKEREDKENRKIKVTEDAGQMFVRGQKELDPGCQSRCLKKAIPLAVFFSATTDVIFVPVLQRQY